MNKKIKIIQMIFCIGAMLYFIGVQYYIGIKVDLINWNNDIERYRLISVMGGILCIIGMFVICKKERNFINIIKKTVIVLIAIVIICTIIFIPKWDKYEGRNFTSKDEYFYEYDWQDVLDKVRTENQYYLLYIGRDNCPQCKIFSPSLKKITEDENVFIIYYNTIPDRDKSDFDQKMNMLKVKSVPCLRIIGNEEVIEVDDNIYDNEKALRKSIRCLKKQYKLPTNDN